MSRRVWGRAHARPVVRQRDERKFTTKERDAESQLDYFGARSYASAIGRWTTVDPAVAADSTPQWSPYGYVKGNPVNYSDPFGLATCPPVCGEVFADLARRLAPLENTLNAVGEVTGINDLGRAGDELVKGKVVAGGLGLALALPIGPGEAGAAIRGTKEVVRGGLEGLGLGEKVLSGVRGVLSSGRADQVMVQATSEGGAMVLRWVKGSNTVSSAMYHYVIDNTGKVVGAAKQAYDRVGAIPGTFKPY